MLQTLLLCALLLGGGVVAVAPTVDADIPPLGELGPDEPPGSGCRPTCFLQDLPLPMP